MAGLVLGPDATVSFDLKGKKLEILLSGQTEAASGLDSKEMDFVFFFGLSRLDKSCIRLFDVHRRHRMRARLPEPIRIH